jgi:hypothetical protein
MAQMARSLYALQPLFVIVPMKHFLENAPADYMETLKKNPHLLTFVDPEFDINP